MQRTYRTAAFIVAVALTAALGAGCAGDPRAEKIERGFRHATRLLDETRTDIPTALSYVSIAEQGGTPVTFLTANARDPKTLPPYIWEGPPAAFSIVLRNGERPGEIIVEAYNEKTDTPAHSATIENCGSAEKRLD